MNHIGEKAPTVKGYVEKPYTNCKWCDANLEPNETMMYYCDTSCYYKQNQEGSQVDSHCSHEHTDLCWTYDCVYCVDCHQWLESKCDDEDCNYCSLRPANYGKVLNGYEHTVNGYAQQIKGLPQ